MISFIIWRSIMEMRFLQYSSYKYWIEIFLSKMEQIEQIFLQGVLFTLTEELLIEIASSLSSLKGLRSLLLFSWIDNVFCRKYYYTD
ncbi:hypothetical protein SAMN05443633_1021 [Chryseobacterium arachidis]|uniref:Uncharacterized protein n=2 Tax=Chryseobacterium arachidis TaxID=1416778 RepID=A0A1M4WB22_9FLAO|nr:hypothetical protein [Chryseobacterium arachidis]SHE78434.1 hypothetical protein SAMN05443633_1021 [Chryseobacterium arachidis]